MVDLSTDLVTRVARLAASRPLVLVGVDGKGGAGKSCWAAALATALAPLPVAEVHMDDFYLPSALRTREEPIPVGGAFDWRRLRDQVLVPLLSGRAASFARYDWNADALAETHELRPRGVVVVEGVYALRQELSTLYDLCVWVDCPREVRLARGLERDGEEARANWEQEWMPAEDRYVREHRPRERADVCVNGCAPALGLVEPPACPEVRDARPDEREEVVRFLREAQYGGGVLPSDRLVISVRDGCLAGAFRLAREEGVLVLRGMRVREDVRRAGIGLCLLGALADLDEVCFCVPHTHLDVFYGRAEFVRLPEAEMPAFLRDRARRYREQGLDVIVMRRDPRRDRRTPVELQSFEHVHALMPVTNDAHWSGFHEIRERVLFIERGEALAYDRCHPHDRAPGNHPMLLTCDGVPVGAVRVDLVPEHGVAIMRMVAVASGAQRRGHGRKMLALAEDFARERGCSTAAVFAAEDAVGFYARCGYMSETWDPDEQYGGGVQMTKALVR